MQTTTKAALALLCGCSLTACAGMTQMQDSLSKFDSAAHSVSTTQSTFYRNVQIQDCTTQFYANTATWAAGAAKTYDLTGACTPQALTSAQIHTRVNLLNAIALYADKLQALASTSGDKNLDTNSQNLASQLNAAATAHGLSKADASIGADVEAAVIGIAQMALDQRRFKDAKAAAAAVQPQLEAVVTTLKAENTSFVAVFESKREKLELSLRSVIAQIPPSDVSQRFDAVLSARQIYAATNPFGAETLTSAGSQPAPDPLKLNAALDGLVSANKAIANAGPGGIVAAVNDLVARAQAAQADQAALSQ